MGEEATLALVSILAKTLEHLEQNSDPDDPAVQQVKHSILLIIAEFELISLKEKPPEDELLSRIRFARSPSDSRSLCYTRMFFQHS